MKMLHGSTLAEEFRKLSDAAKERVWIVSPYIGKCLAVKALLGSSWWLGSSVQLRVVTDLSYAGNVNRETLEKLAERGTVKTISGVHAKLYIFDKRAIVTSANLTETAFTKRREVGILLDEREVKLADELFADWWDHYSASIDQSQLPVWKKRGAQNDAEPEGRGLPKLWELPTAPPESEFAQKGGGAKAAFSRYQAFLKCYEELAVEYESNQRLLPKVPIFIEVDTFLNFLYHDPSAGTPSHSFRNTNKARELTEKQRVAEVAKWAGKFAKSSDVQPDI